MLLDPFSHSLLWCCCTAVMNSNDFIIVLHKVLVSLAAAMGTAFPLAVTWDGVVPSL